MENPAESVYVRMIFDMFTEENLSYNQIANRMNVIGAPTRTGAPWSSSTVRLIIKNIHYTGLISYGAHGVTKVKDPKTGRTKKIRIATPENRRVYEGKHQPLITKEQYEKAQSLCTERPPIHSNAIQQNVLAGLLYCSKCGRSARTAHNCTRYMHQTMIDSSCTTKSVSVSSMISALADALKISIADFNVQLESSGADDLQRRHADLIASIEKEIAQQQRRKIRLMDEYESEDSPYTRAEFIERKAMYTSTIESLEEQLASARASAPQPIDYAGKITTAHALLDCLNDPTIPAHDKNLFLKENIDRITYDV